MVMKKKNRSPTGSDEEVKEEVKEEPKEESEEEPEEESADEETETYKTKFELYHEFIQVTKDFLNQYDRMVENRTKYRTLYLVHLNRFRGTLITLLHQFILNQLPRDDYLYQHIKCCGEEMLNNEEFAVHYKEAHRKADKVISLPEMDEIRAYHKACKRYIRDGRVVNDKLLLLLRRLLRKTNTILSQS
ncbi:uncharacterized protein LOC129779431 [Toxorhynchites rutilus septentrionalis]|uniref:uncharacterized protein LOC129779431 n=1 Tax=Toxorhynchites rutilus septentrionalis TaxID=329112 RepID=UPI00247AE7ED|nr:uncharacterized protein LOC129779431 [Toxorhynchites rutilus septentrionalis]